jgi:lysophospholipase L1-like esterase
MPTEATEQRPDSETTTSGHRTDETPRVKRAAFWLVLLTLLALVSLVVSEAALRLFFEEEEVNANYWGRGAFVESADAGYRHAPGYVGRAYRRGVFATPVTISAEGLRQSNVPAQQAFPRRLLVLGDSYAFGLGVLEEEGFVARLQPALNAHGIGVINGAQSGYCVEQEARLGRALAAQYRPDTIVLAVFVGNDVEGDFVADYATVDVRYGFRLFKERWLPFAPLDYLRTHSYLALWLQSRRNRARYIEVYQGFAELARREPATVMRPTLTAIEVFARECQDAGRRLVVLVVPRRKDTRGFYEILVRELKVRGISFLDLETAGLGPEDYFVGDGHWNARGHARVARLLGAFLQNLEPPPSGAASVAAASPRHVEGR